MTGRSEVIGLFGDYQFTDLFPVNQLLPENLRRTKNEAWERGYLGGRYGAVPFFGDVPFLSPTSSMGHDALRNGSLRAQA